MLSARFVASLLLTATFATACSLITETAPLPGQTSTSASSSSAGGAGGTIDPTGGAGGVAGMAGMAGAGGVPGTGGMAGAGGTAGGGGGAMASVPKPEFALADVNPNSKTFGTNVSPSQYMGRVSAWYFGHST